MKNFKIIAVFVILILSTVLLLNTQTIEDYYTAIDKTEDFSVFVSINCDTVNNNYSKLDESLKNTEYIPKDGIILPKTKVFVKEGDTVLDATKKVASINKIQLEYTQSPNDSYVQGINYLYEFSCGDLSGWMYTVNGEFANVGSNSYRLQEGDSVCWLYTCDLGKDIGDEFE